VQDVLIVWGDHDQLFPLEKAFAVQRYSDGFRAHAVQFLFFFLSQTDGCRPCANVAVLFRSLNGSARLEVVKKTGHAPQLEDPARFNKVMLDFLLAAHKPDPSV